MPRTRWKSRFLWLLVFLGIVMWFPRPLPAVETFQKMQPRKLHLVYDIRVSSDAPVTEVSLQVPLIHSALPLYQELLEIRALWPGRLRKLEDSNWIAQAAWPSLQPSGPGLFEVAITLQHHRPSFRINADLCQPDYSRWPDLAVYLSPEPGIESDHELIREYAARIAGNTANPYIRSRQIFAFVNTHMNYEPAGAWGKGALWALEQGRGVCQEYTDLFVALCRASGVPARRVYGFRYNLKDDGDLRTQKPLYDKHHVWAEVFLPPYQWVPVEPTYVYTVNGQKRVSYDYFGTFPPDDLHIASGFTNPPVQWNFRFQGKQPMVETSIREFMHQGLP